MVKSKKYTNKDFHKDIRSLKALIDDFKGGAVKKNTRRFTIVEVNGKKIAGGEGSYTGASHSQAAKKACTRACSKRGKAKLQFALRETTQGSDKKVKHYTCERIKRKKPIVIKYKTGAVAKITHDTHVMEISK